MAEELEIEISQDGKVQVHVKGAKGKKCLDYVEIFRQFLGTVKSQEVTPEYYEAEEQVHIEQRINQK